MKDKEQIVENWLPRYTGVPLDGFGEHILLTNFGGYLGHFSRWPGPKTAAATRPFPTPPPAGSTMTTSGLAVPTRPPLLDFLRPTCPKSGPSPASAGGP